MRVEHPQCLTAAEKWLAADIGVLVTGDIGSGKSVVLAELGRQALGRGVHVLSLQGARTTQDVPLAAFALHPQWVKPRAGERVTAGEVRNHFLEELQGRRNLLIVDDVDLLDSASLAVVESLVALSGCGVLFSVRTGVAPGPWLTFGTGGQPLARVPVDTIGIRGAARILEDHLEGAVDMSLIAAVTAWSGGNARAALALVDAGVWSGAVGRVDGRWAELTSLEDVPHGMVADAFRPSLDAAELAALEMLAWFGPLELQHAVRLAGTAAVQRLMTLERLSSFRTQGGQSVLVAVSPPCLAHAVRLGINVVRRDELMERFDQTFDGTLAADQLQGTSASTPWWGADGDRDRSLVGTEPLPVVAERLAAQTVLRRDAWRSAPSVATATPLLESLMNSAPPVVEMDEVFAETPIEPGKDRLATIGFVMMQAQWVAFREADVAAGVAILEGHLEHAGPLAPLLRAQVMAFESSRKGSAELLEASAGFPAAPEPENAWYAALRAGLLMETGRPDLALELLHEWDLEPESAAGSVTDQLRALRADSLLLDGQVAEALQYSQECLALAYDRLDPLGIRMHSRGVATALLFSGDSEAAWKVLSTVLRLGPPGPVNVPYYQRILAMASVLRARQGDVHLSASLLQQLESMPRTYPPVLDAMAPWARAELLCSQGQSEEATTLMWEAGLERRDLGFPGSALLCWLLRAEQCTAAELDEMKKVWSDAPVPVFAGLVELHTQLVEGGPDEILDALAAVGPVAGKWLTVKALELAAQGRKEAGLEPFTPQELLQRAGAWVTEEAAAVGMVSEAAEPLSDRELEVALLARSGLTNREIANRLYLSVRTVENHMYRTLRKLGIASRAELVTDWDPDAPQ